MPKYFCTKMHVKLIGWSSFSQYVFLSIESIEHDFIKTVMVFSLNGAELSLNSANSGNLRNH